MGLAVLAIFAWMAFVKPAVPPAAIPSNRHPSAEATPAEPRIPGPGITSGDRPSPVPPAEDELRKPRRIALPPDFLDGLVRGSAVIIGLPDGREVNCEAPRIEADEKGVVSLTGEFSKPVPGTFFFRRQDFPGVAGKLVGNVIFKGEPSAWKILPEGIDGDPVLKEVPIGEVICVDYSPPLEMPQDHPSTVALPEYQDVIPLESLPGAPGVIYLDFDGSKGPHDTWSYKGDAAHSGFSNSTIRDIWIRVAEDFLPFNMNVTTDAGVYDTATRGRRIRCIISPTNWHNAGGVAYVGSYNWGGDPVCWSLNYTGDGAVTVISHEVGHTLGLYHHGYDTSEYYGGHGSGVTGWAPIMGSGYGKTLKHWSDGSYYLATRKSQKDLTTITNQNGVDFRPDDCGSNLAGARYLWIAPGSAVANQQGLVETPGDIDAFRFKTNGGAINLNVITGSNSYNLDIKADIADAATGTVVLTSDSAGSANAALVTTLPAGEYLLRVTGASVGTPATTRGGYSNYGCLGSYRIDGTVTGGETHQAFTIAEHSANGTSIGTVTPRAVSGSPLSYTIASGNTGGILALNPSTGALTVANSTALDFETLSARYDVTAQFELFVTIADNSTSVTETVRAIVTVNDVNEAPVLAAVSDIRIPERSAVGTQVLELSATDADRFDGPVYEIVSGNTEGRFAINPRTGWITVADAPSVTADTPITLTVRARDQKTPTRYSASRTLTITFFNLPDTFTGNPGGLYRTFFRNISGSAVTDLTGNASFPNNPSDEVFLTSFDGGSDKGDNYGSTIRGYLIPPATGSYQFWIAGDNGAQLILAPGSAQTSTPVIASVATSGEYAWDQQASQASAAISLSGGQIYYIEARHKEATFGDHLAVAWSGPGLSRQVILGTYLAPFPQNYAPRPSGTFSIMETAPTGTVVGTPSVADVNTGDSHAAFAITAGNTGNLFAINPATGQLTVAVAGQFNAATKPFHDLTVSTTDDGTPPLAGSGTVRVNIQPSRLYFDPNGSTAGSVADGGSYAWRSASWAAAQGGTAAVGNWISNSQAFFSASTPPGSLAYDVDIAAYNSGTHGGFGAIRALGGTVRFTGSVDNFYLTGDLAVEAAEGSAIEFNQTRSGDAALAFNLNGKTATFDGHVTLNTCGMSSNGNVVVDRGKLTLNAANRYTGATTVNGGTLSLIGSGALYTTLNFANQTVTLKPGATLELDRWIGSNRSLGQLGYAAQNLVIDGATLRYTGLTNPLETDNGPGFTIGENGATLESASAGEMWRILVDGRNAGFGIASNGGPLTLAGSGNGSITKVIPGTDTALVKTGSGTWNLGAINSYGGGTTVEEGTLQCNNPASLPGDVSITSDSTDESKFGTLFMSVGNSTWSQNVSGSGLWRVATTSGSQTTVLSGNYSSFNGTLQATTGSGKIQLGTAARYPAAGSMIQLTANTALYLSGGGTLASDFRLDGGSIGEPTFGQLRVGAANAILNGDIALHANSSIAADSSRIATINGAIGESGGSFGFTKNQPGTLVLTATNTYTGSTTVNAGILQTGTTTGKLGPGNLTVANGATCQIRHGNGALGRHAHVSLNGTGKLDLATGVTETVARLFVGGVQQAAGTYTKTNLAANITGNGSLVVGEVAPFAPTNLSASLASWNSVRLTWSHSAVNETSLRVERSLSANSGFAEIATLAPGALSFVDAGRPANTTCFYRLRVSNTLGFSPYSDVVSITTGAVDAPLGLTATASNGAVLLSWTGNPEATGYNVKRATVSGGPYAQIGSTASTAYNDTTVNNGTAYYYIVTATAAGFESLPSDEVGTRPLPPPGNGIWITDSGGKWSDAENWQNFVVADGAGNSASFGQAGGGTIDLDSTDRSLGSLSFSNGNYEVTGSPLALDATSGAPLVSVGGGLTATIAASLTGAEGLEKTGAGRLIVVADSTITGPATVSAGTLTHRGLHASNSVAIAAGAVFEVEATAAAMNQVTTAFTGAGTLRKTGSNRVFWGTSIGTFGLSTGALIDVLGGTFTGGSNANEVWTNNRADLNVAAGAVFDGVEANVRVDGISGSGTIRTGYNGGNYANLTIGVDNGSSTFSGVIANSSSTGNLVKEGSGSITLAGTNTFTGGVAINRGVLRIARSGGLGSGTKTVNLNAANVDKTLELDGTGGNITVASSISYQTSGVNGVIRNLAGNNTIAGAITMTDGNGGTRITSDGGALLLSGAINASATGRTLDLGGTSTGNNTISAVIGSANAPAVAKNGTGTWILGGNNTYTGSTSVSEGILTLAAHRSANLGAAVAVGNTADKTATLNIQGDLPFAGQEFGVGSTAAGATGIVNHSAGLVSFTSGNALLIGRSTGGVSGTYHLSGGELRTFTSSSRGVMIGVNEGSSGNPIRATFILSGTGNLNNASGALQVVRADSIAAWQDASYQQSGGTSNHGTLVIGGNGANGANSTASFSVTGGSFSATSFGNLSQGNNVASALSIGGDAVVNLPAFPVTRGSNSTATLTFDGGTLRPTAASTTYLGGLTQAWIRSGGAGFDVPAGRDITITQLFQPHASSSGGSLAKSGPGTLTLSAANTYDGPTIVHDGTLVAASTARLGTSHLTVNDAAACDLRNTTGAIADAAHVHLNGSGRLILASGVAETVARLYLNNTLQAAGTYTAASHPAFISGNGSLVVTTSLPVAPSSLAATAVSHQTIDLTWTDNEAGETGYLVERSATTTSGFTQIAALPANSTRYSDTGLPAASTRFYRVRAAAGSGNSASSNEASATTLPSPPAAPSGLTASAGGFAVRLDWTAVPAATAYRIRRSTNSGSGFTQVGSTSATHFIDGNLAAGVPVFYQVSAEISGSVGADSAEVSATPLASVQWDGGDLVTTGAQGGSGPWNSNARWWNGFTNATWPATGLLSEAVFAGSAGTVTLDPAGLTANRLAFNTSGYQLESGPLTLNGSSPSIFTPAGVTTGISSAIGGSAGLAKTGTGSLVLGGSNSYGATFIQQGHLQVNPGGSLGSGSLNLGTGAAGALGTVGNLALNTDASAGAIQVVSNTSDTGTASNIGQLLIASGRTLTATSFSAGLASSSAGSTRTALATGPADSGGTLTVNGSVVIGNSGSAGNTLTSVDLSGLGAFNLNAPTGHLRIGYGALTKGTLTLATQSTINTATISVGETIGSGNSSQFSTLHLGSGTNTLQTNDLRIGIEKTAGVVQFAGPAGSVTITGTHGSGKAAIAVGRATGGSYQGIGTNSLLLAGHPATVNASTVVIGRKGTGTSTGNITAALSFDTGTFSADEIRLADVVAGSANTSATGTFTLGTDSTATGVLTVNGAFILATNTNSTSAQTATGSLVINGGTAKLLGAIKDASTTTLGASNTTLTLDGGTLDLNGHPIGGDGSAGNLAIDSLHFRRGTLKNVSQINHGATGLNKTGSGLLTLSGTHTYTGPTTIAAGKLVLDGTITSDLTATSGTLAVQGEPAITGDLDIPAAGRFEAAPGVTLTVSGSITLAGALDLISPPGLAVGDSFILLDKAGGGAVDGAFLGKPEASTFTAGDRSWRITYVGGDGNDVAVTVAPSSAIAAWRDTHFGSPDNSANAADSADPNHDGEANLLEFATGQNPQAATRASVSLLPASGGMLAFTYTRNRAAFDDGILFDVQYSDSLAAPWTSAGPGTVETDGPAQSVRALIPAGPAGRRFVRLNVSAP